MRKALVAGILGLALSAPAKAQYETQQLYPFKGLYLASGASVIAPEYATEAQNVWYLREGGIQTRPGFALLNSTKISDDPPWLLYRKRGLFLIGDSTFIWKMGEAGQFADPDSILSYRDGTVKTVASDAALTGYGTKWSRTLQTGDIIRVGAKRYTVGRVFGDSIIRIGAGSDAMVNDSGNYQALFVFKGKTGGAVETSRPTFGTATEINGNLVLGTEARGAVVINSGGVASLLGIVAEGRVDSITNTNGTNWCNRRVVDSTRNLVANAYNGYAIVLHNKVLNTEDGKGDRSVYYAGKILTNDAASFTLSSQPNISTTQSFTYKGAGVTWETGLGAGKFSQLRYTVFAPLFTIIDTGTVHVAGLLDTGVIVGHYTFRDTSTGHTPVDAQADQTILEFTTGQFAGQQVHLVEITTPAGYVHFNCSDAAFVQNKGIRPARGDKYVVYKIGASGRHFLWYANQLVLANSRVFPNQIRWSTAGTIHDFAPSNYRAIIDRAGNQIVGIRDLNGDLAIWQEGDTWKMPGGDLSTAQLIHALSGVGCPAPRSLAVSGSQAYWLTIQSGMPKAVAWGGGGLKFNVVGDPSVYAGGDLQDISRPIVPLMKGLNLANISKAAGGFWEDHYLLSVPESASTVPSHTYCYHIPTGRWARANFAGSIYYNATSAPDSGQLYFGNRHIGKINRFGGVETDTGSNIAMAYATGDFTFGSSNTTKQLGSVELDCEKANTDSIALQVYKNLPAALVNGYSLASGLTGYRTIRRGFGGVVGKSLRFRLSYAAGQGIKFHAFRFTYLPIGVP